MTDSYIKLWRCIEDWEWKSDPYMVALWIDILIQANWYPRKWKGVELPPGSFPTSVESLSERTGLTKQQVRTCLKRLKSTNEITSKSTNRFTVITVIKWGDFQPTEENLTNKSTNKLTNKQQTDNKQITNKQQTNNKQITTLKEIKNIRKEEIKNIYGVYGHVKLTDSQRMKLEEELGNPFAEKCIQTLDNYCESSGKSYKNYYQAIHNWVIDRVERDNRSRSYEKQQSDIKVDYDAHTNEATDMTNLEQFLKERKDERNIDKN